MSNMKKLTTSAIFIALSVVLVFLSKMIPAPWLQGGSVTPASMVPVIIISLVIDTKWGLLSAFAFALIQMLFGFQPPPTQNFFSFVAVVLLDYLFAFGVLGLSGAMWYCFGKKPWAIPVSGIFVCALRYLCHILSGVLIWGVYAPEGQSVLIYSVLYNGSYMLPETIITAVVLCLLRKMIQKERKRFHPDE